MTKEEKRAEKKARREMEDAKDPNMVPRRSPEEIALDMMRMDREDYSSEEEALLETLNKPDEELSVQELVAKRKVAKRLMKEERERIV